jgi:hypothetical protein
MSRVLCLLSVLLPQVVLALCMEESLTVWPPPGQPLPVNGQLVLEGYGRTQEPVARIAEHSPRLVTEGDEVPLRIIAIHRGEKRLTQAVLQPERPLQPDRRYALRLKQPVASDVPELPARVWRNDLEWMISRPDVTPPRWREVPRTTGQELEEFGCGPAIHVAVSALVEDDGPRVQVLAEVRRAEGGTPVRFRLTPKGEKVEIGHDMCSGGFELQAGVQYTVRLVAVDMAGNESVAPGGEVLVEGPRRY